MSREPCEARASRDSPSDEGPRYAGVIERSRARWNHCAPGEDLCTGSLNPRRAALVQSRPPATHVRIFGSVLELWWAWAVVFEIVWVMVLSVYVLLEGRSPQATIAWILALSFLPLVGLPVYYLIGPRRFDRRKRRRLRAQAAVKKAWSLPETQGVGHDSTDARRHLMRMCETAAGSSARPRTGRVALFTDGAAAYSAVKEAIANAQHHVHLEYYIWEPDETGTGLRDLLTERAKAGVEVRLLVDGFGSSNASDRFFRPLREAGAFVERFNALARWRPRMTNFRTHRKIIVCDGRVGFVGGMNVSNVHTSEHSGADAWRDTHMRLEGRAVRGLQMVFCEDWHYATGSSPAGKPYLLDKGDLEEASHIVQVVASGPDENMDAIHKLFFSAMAGAHRRVLATSPYFVPDPPIVNALVTASLRGADVRVLVPSGGDIPLVAAAARSYYEDLLETGVRIFEYGPPVLHSKTLVVDDDLAVVGTANIDNRSFRLNFEVVAAIYDGDTCRELADAFEHDLQNAREVTLEALDAEPFRRRLFSAMARLLSPIL